MDVHREFQFGMNTPPSGPAPEPRARRCYAAALGDCAGPISSEHFLSRGILERLGEPLTVNGLACSAGPVQRSAKALGSNVLCKHHNEMLASLDAAAVRLFDCLDAFHAARPFGLANLEGDFIERWLLKLLFGFVASGNPTRADGATTKGTAPPDQWIRVLFGYEEPPPGCGLYFFERPRGEIAFEQIEVTINSDPDSRIYGIRVELLGFNFHFGMRPFVSSGPEFYLHRPAGFRFEHIESTMLLSWQGQSSQKLVMIGREPEDADRSNFAPQ